MTRLDEADRREVARWHAHKPGSPRAALWTGRWLVLMSVYMVGGVWTAGHFVVVQPGTRPGILGSWVAPLVCAAFVLAGFAQMLKFRRRALGHAVNAAREAAEGKNTGEADAVTGSLLIAWFFLSLPAFIVGVLYAHSWHEAYLLAVPLYLLGMVLTFPRRKWYGLEAHR